MNSSNDTEHFRDVETWLLVVHGTCLSVLLSLSMAGNSLALGLVLCNKVLQYRSVLVSLGLVVADMLLALSWTTQSLGVIIAGQCPFGVTGCSILGNLTNISIYARWCIIAVITVERFWCILWPFSYAKWSKLVLIILSVLSWVVASSTVVPWLAGLGSYQFRRVYSACIIACKPDDIACFRFYIIIYGAFLAIGGVLPMVLYLLLCIIGQRKAYKMRHITLGTVNKPPLPNDQESGNATSAITTQQDGNSQTLPTDIPSLDDFRSRQDSTSSSGSRGRQVERKILITFFMIFVNVLITQLPIYITSALRSMEEVFQTIPLMVHFMIVHIYLLGPVLDPLFIMRNKDFRDVIMKPYRRRTRRTNLKNTLVEFAKMSAFMEISPTRKNGRRNSCPAAARSVVANAPSPIIKARSYSGCEQGERISTPQVEHIPEGSRTIHH